MQLVGFLGGMSWESTAEYYRVANELVRDRLGGLHSARCVTYSVDFAGIEAMQVEGRWDDAGAVLALAGQALESAGADLVVLVHSTTKSAPADSSARPASASAAPASSQRPSTCIASIPAKSTE